MLVKFLVKHKHTHTQFLVKHTHRHREEKCVVYISRGAYHLI